MVASILLNQKRIFIQNHQSPKNLIIDNVYNIIFMYYIGMTAGTRKQHAEPSDIKREM